MKNKKKAISKKQKKEQKIKNIRTVLIVIWFLTIFYILTSATVVTKTIEAPLTYNKTIINKVPYTDLVPYNITEEYEEYVPFGVPYCSPQPCNFTKVEHVATLESNNIVCRMEITNLENESCTWTYDVQLKLGESFVDKPEQTQEIKGNSNGEFKWYFDITTSGFEETACRYLQVSLPLIQKCFIREPYTYSLVKKTRTVTKFRNITKYNETVDYQLVTEKTNQTLNVPINRFFGYRQLFYLGY